MSRARARASRRWRPRCDREDRFFQRWAGRLRAGPDYSN